MAAELCCVNELLWMVSFRQWERMGATIALIHISFLLSDVCFSSLFMWSSNVTLDVESFAKYCMYCVHPYFKIQKLKLALLAVVSTLLMISTRLESGRAVGYLALSHWNLVTQLIISAETQMVYLSIKTR